MKNIYFLIWVDIIVSAKKNHPNEGWKFPLFALITLSQALNLWVIFIWLKFLGVNVLLIRIPFMEGTVINGFLVFFIQFGLVIAILNYFFVFFRDRYKWLIKKYPNRNGKLAMKYGLITASSTFISAMLTYWLI